MTACWLVVAVGTLFTLLWSDMEARSSQLQFSQDYPDCFWTEKWHEGIVEPARPLLFAFWFVQIKYGLIWIGKLIEADLGFFWQDMEAQLAGNSWSQSQPTLASQLATQMILFHEFNWKFLHFLFNLLWFPPLPDPLRAAFNQPPPQPLLLTFVRLNQGHFGRWCVMFFKLSSPTLSYNKMFLLLP